MKASSVMTRKVLLELTEAEATVLCSLVGGVPWNSEHEAGSVIREVYDGLNEQLPDRVESYSDFFEGFVETVK